jgi:hypothetical protein
MNKKGFLLVLIGIIICFCCLLVFGGFMVYRIINTQSTSMPSLEGQTEGYSVTSTPMKGIATQQTTNDPESNLQFATETGDQLLICMEKIDDFDVLAVQLNENISLISDAAYQAETTKLVDQIERSCTAIAQGENVPPQYLEVNQYVVLGDENMTLFLENFRIGIDQQDIESISQSLQNLAIARGYDQEALNLLSE